MATAPGENPALDYATLRAEGIRQLERMASGRWTDFNAHDPGITILEQLCYALTDLAYRIDYDLPDLLAGAGDPALSLYTPAQVLASEPVTLTDLRKLVLDVPGVRNAWIEPIDDPAPGLRHREEAGDLVLGGDELGSEPVPLKGLHRVLIEADDAGGSVAIGEVPGEVARLLHAHRNLCEDFAEVVLLDPIPVVVRAGVEIGPVDDAGRVLAEIYRRIADYFSPPVRFLTLDEMLASGRRIDEVFEGPALRHGFLDSEALARLGRRTVIHASDLIHEIMSVPGVRAVRRITVAEGGREEPWSLSLGGGVPRLDARNSEITLERGRLRARPDAEGGTASPPGTRGDVGDRAPLPPERLDLPLPRGRDRDVARYHSIQHQFPALYGIGAMGLPDSAPPRRKAQAKQLKAYLLFFDQILANDFAQLAHLGDLFSFEEGDPRTYFSDAIDDPALGIDEVRRGTPAEHAERLRRITEGGDDALARRRRDRFLNHLLARFAEQFSQYSLALSDATPKGASPTIETLIRDKAAFLRRYPRVSGARGTGFDYRQPPGPENASGLEERVRLKLGVAPGSEEGFFLVEHILLRPMGGDAAQGLPLLSAVRGRDPYSLQLSFVFPTAGRFANDSFRQLAEQTVRDETPAHLVPRTVWLDGPAMAAFRDAYANWLDKLGRYWAK